jgi:hypothetical protein
VVFFDILSAVFTINETADVFLSTHSAVTFFTPRAELECFTFREVRVKYLLCFVGLETLVSSKLVMTVHTTCEGCIMGVSTSTAPAVPRTAVIALVVVKNHTFFTVKVTIKCLAGVQNSVEMGVVQ